MPASAFTDAQESRKAHCVRRLRPGHWRKMTPTIPMSPACAPARQGSFFSLGYYELSWGVGDPPGAVVCVQMREQLEALKSMLENSLRLLLFS